MLMPYTFWAGGYSPIPFTIEGASACIEVAEKLNRPGEAPGAAQGTVPPKLSALGKSMWH
jgi:hypothetical protein